MPFFVWALDDIEQTIPERFARVADENPQRIALKSRDRAWTYAQLNQSARSIAHEILRRRGGSIETVGLLFDQGVWVIAATLGALMAHKIYVPLDPTLPPLRTAEVLQDAEIGLVLTDHAHWAQASALCQTRGFSILNVESIAPTAGLPALARISRRPSLHFLYVRFDRQTERRSQFSPQHSAYCFAVH